MGLPCRAACTPASSTHPRETPEHAARSGQLRTNGTSWDLSYQGQLLLSLLRARGFLGSGREPWSCLGRAWLRMIDAADARDLPPLPGFQGPGNLIAGS